MESFALFGRVVCLILGGVLSLGMAGAAEAGPVTLTFTGTIATGYDSSSLFGGGSLTGDRFTTSISFDPLAIGTSSCGTSTLTTSCNWSTSGSSSFTQSLTMTAGGHDYTQDFTGATTSSLSFSSGGNDAIYLSFGGSGFSFSLNAVDLTKSGFFANDANVNNLNLDFTDVALDPNASAEYGNRNSTSFTMSFNTLSATSGAGTGTGSGTTVVPEPSTWALFGMGIFGVALVRRRVPKYVSAQI